jgi:hypothetical protein
MRLRDAIEMLADSAVEALGVTTWVDLGCGEGTFTLALADVLATGSTIHAMDRDASALRKIRRHERGPLAGIAVQRGVAQLFHTPPPLGVCHRSSLLGWYEALQLFGPVLDDNETRSSCRGRFNHDETTPITRHVKIGVKRGFECTFEKKLWSPGAERWHKLHVGYHQPVLATVEQLAATGSPDGPSTPFGGDLPLGPGSRKWPHLNLTPSRFVGVIRQPTAIRRKGAPAVVKRCAKEKLRFPVGGRKRPDIPI